MVGKREKNLVMRRGGAPELLTNYGAPDEQRNQSDMEVLVTYKKHQHQQMRRSHDGAKGQQQEEEEEEQEQMLEKRRIRLLTGQQQHGSGLGENFCFER